MSVSANPKATVDFECVTIGGDHFLLKARFLNSIEERRVRDLIATRIDGKLPSDDGVVETAREVIGIGIVGTTADELSQKLTERELCQLAIRYPDALALTEIERGKSMSLLRFTVDKSAATAVAAAATPLPTSAP